MLSYQPAQLQVHMFIYPQVLLGVSAGVIFNLAFMISESEIAAIHARVRPLPVRLGVDEPAALLSERPLVRQMGDLFTTWAAQNPRELGPPRALATILDLGKRLRLLR